MLGVTATPGISLFDQCQRVLFRSRLTGRLNCPCFFAQTARSLVFPVTLNRSNAATVS